MELELKLQTLSKILGDRIRVNINNLRDRFSGLSDLTRKPLIKEKQIFFELFIDEDIEKELKKSMIEQLEIAVQILINKGYKIGVFNSQEKDREICKKFVDVFKTEEIKYLGNIKENLQVLTLLYESEFSIVMSQEFLLYCLVVEKPCISIFINKDLLELVQQKNTCINKENFNAGVLLEKVKYIKENNNAIKKNMSNLFNHCTEERLRANDELVDNKSQSYSLQKEVNIEDRSCVMEDYKKQFKENIHSLIEKGLLVEAKDMITQYEQIVKDDVDIYSIKGVIAMMEGDMDEALILINKGLKINPENLDLLYNKAYLLEQIKEYKESYQLFKRVLLKTSDLNLKQDIKNKLNEIRNIDSSVELKGKLSILIFYNNTNRKFQSFLEKWYFEYGYTIIESLYINIDGQKQKAVILYNLHPNQLTIEEQNNYSEYDDKNYFLINSLKKQVRLDFEIDNVQDYFYHTKNEKEAIRILKNISKDEVIRVNKICKKIENNYFDSYYDVIKPFNSFKHRARVELIRYKDGVAVKKTYKPGCEKFLKRELFAYKELSKKSDIIPPIIEEGSNYIIIPYYENIMINDIEKSEILRRNITKISKFIKFLYDEGYVHLDLHPGNFIYSDKEGLKAIDFEYLQKYTNQPESFEQSYDIVGVPKNFNGDRPNYIGRGLIEYYNNLWLKYTGYSLLEIALLNNKSDISKNQDIDENIKKVLTLVNYTKTSRTIYNAQNFESAYHSLQIKNQYFRGQREPYERLKNVKYDFKDKTVLDIGCNVGGMLHALSSKIKGGVGIDYNYKLINAANSIKAINNSYNLQFYTFNLEEENLDLIDNFILSDKVDICFLLAVCVWIRNWRDVITKASKIAPSLLFESNGTNQQQKEQLDYLKNNYRTLTLVNRYSFDDPRDKSRKLFLCEKSFNYDSEERKS